MYYGLNCVPWKLRESDYSEVGCSTFNNKQGNFN